MGMSKLNLGGLVSGEGTTMQAVYDASISGYFSGKIVTVISDRQCPAIDKAKFLNIPTYITSQDEKICQYLKDNDANYVLLAGYLKKVEGITLNEYRGRIINTHPSLLPKYGGEGMYGDKVHKAVIEAGEKLSGATVHIVDENYDTGPTIGQLPVPVFDTDTYLTLSNRVKASEKVLLLHALEAIARSI